MATRIASALFALTLVFSTACAGLPFAAGSGEAKTPSLAPRDTWLFSQLTFRPSAGQMLLLTRVQSAFTSQPGWDAAWATLNTTASSSGVDIQKDVLPLLDGELAIAAYSDPRDSRFVGFVHSSDAPKLLRILAAADTAARVEPGYKGAPTSTAASGATVLAAYKGWLLFGDSRQAIQQTIDRIDGNGGDSLATVERYTSVVKRLPADRLGFGYEDISANTLDFAREILGGGPLANVVGATGRLAWSFAASTTGIDARLEVLNDRPDPSLKRTTAGIQGAFAQLPSSTILAVAGSDLGGLLGRALEAAIRSAEESDLNTGDSTEQGLALIQSLRDLVAGDWAIGAGREVIQGFTGSGTPTSGVHAIARVNDPLAIADALNGVLPENVLRLGEGSESAWTSDSFEGSAMTAGLDGPILFAGLGGPESVFAARSSLGFSGNDRYNRLKPIFDRAEAGVFADIQAIRETVVDSLSASDRASYERDVRPFIAPIKAVGSAARFEDAMSATGDLLILISP